MTRKAFTDLYSDPSLETPVVSEYDLRGYLLESIRIVYSQPSLVWDSLVLPLPLL